MFRRGLSVLVLLGFFANQLALIPHAHGTDLPGHESRPHVHLAGLTQASHGHDHYHSHEHDHPERGDGASHGLADRASGGVEPLTDHDADALYLHGGSNNSATAPSLKAVDQQVTLQSWLVVPVQGSLMTTGRPSWPPPDESGDACQLFLRLRNLRI